MKLGQVEGLPDLVQKSGKTHAIENFQKYRYIFFSFPPLFDAEIAKRVAQFWFKVRYDTLI